MDNLLLPVYSFIINNKSNLKQSGYEKKIDFLPACCRVYVGIGAQHICHDVFYQGRRVG